MPTPRPSAPVCLSSVRLPPPEVQALLSDLDHRTVDPAGADRRRAGRVAFRGPSPVVIRVEHADGGVSHYRVIPRNISAEGLGFLHGSYLHAATPCLVILRRLDGQAVQIAGTIVTCRHVRGTTHEVGVHFTQPIDLSAIQPLPTPEPEGEPQS